jgi:hypothetical protein
MSGKAVRETLGFLAVVASLVFVGLEIQQNTAVARGQTRQELATSAQEWLTLRVTDPELSAAFDAYWIGDADVESIQSDRLQLMMRMFLVRVENVYLQYSEGLVDEAALNSYGLGATVYFLRARFQDWWVGDGVRDDFDPGFVAFFDALYGLTG